MEPAITCLDHVLSRRDPAPDEIRMGSIIGYESCGQHNLHRVVQIREVKGERQYLTKGDNNLLDDDCWVPHSDVTQFVVRVERNMVLKNLQMRSGVNLARAKMLANPDHPEARKRFLCWRDAAVKSRYPGDTRHEC